MDWLTRIKNNIFPLSYEKKDIRKALKEWEYYGEMYDTEDTSEDCQLCDHPNIRYQFEITNIINGNILLIGSECILRFGIGVVDDEGKILNSEDAKRKVRSDRKRLVEEAKAKSVINSLIYLSSKDTEFDFNAFINYYRERQAFTPNQLSMLIWRLDKYQINYKKEYLKIIIKRDREKEQLLSMEDWKIKKIWNCLSPSQKRFYEENIRRVKLYENRKK